MIIFQRHANETIWKPWLYVTKINAKSRENYSLFQEWSYTHTCQISTMCVHYQILFHCSSNLMFAVEHAFTSFYLMFTGHAQQTKNAFAAAYSTEITVLCRLVLWSCLVTWSWEAFSCMESIQFLSVGVLLVNSPSSTSIKARSVGLYSLLIPSIWYLLWYLSFRKPS